MLIRLPRVRRAHSSKKLLLPCLVLCLSCAVSVPFAGAQEMLRFEHLTAEDGLPDDMINALAQDGLGFLWIGTPDGLGRFDGYTVRTYAHDPDDARSLPHNDVRGLAVDPEGRLWLATRGGGLARYDVASDSFEVWRKSADEPGGLGSDHLTSLAFDGQGSLWIGTRTMGASRMDLATETFVNYPPDDEADGALRGSRITEVLVSREGDVWLAGMGHGLYRFEPETEGFRQFLGQPEASTSLPGNRVLSLHEDGAGRLWVGTRGGLASWDSSTESFRRWSLGDSSDAGLARASVADIVDSAEGGLWLALAGVGLQHFDPTTEATRLFRHQPTTRHSLASPSVSALLADRTGLLWIGTDSGLDRHDPATQRFESYQFDPESAEDLPGDNLWGFGQTQDGALWLAIAGEGVVRFDPMAGTWENFRHDPADPSSLASNDLFCLLVDTSDRVWVGTANAGLDLYDPASGGWIHHRHDPDDPTTISKNQIYALREGQGGRLWLGLGRGFDHFDPATGVFDHPAFIEGDPDGGMLATTFDLVEDANGLLWIGTFLNGLHTLEPETRTWDKYAPDPEIADSLPTYRTNALLVDVEGRVWAGTDSGLFRHKGNGNHWRRFGRKEGLVNESISALHQGPEGHIWVGTSHGLHRLDPSSGEIRVLVASDGLPDSEIAWHTLLTLDDGRLGVGTSRGFALLEPGALAARRQPPKTVLTGLELFNETVPIVPPGELSEGASGLTLDRSLLATDSMTVDHSQSLLTFEFSALHFARSERLRYSYRLQGWDSEWLETTAQRRSATYTNLPAGDYVFEVRAAHERGDWGEPSAPLQVRVLPPPWKTWWAYTLYSLFVLGLLAGLVWTLHRRAETQRARAEHEAALNEKLRRVDKLKDEFLANTSHELRTPLFGIIGLAESLIDGATGRLQETTVRNLAMIVASGKRLGALINDLLDFSKLEHENLVLRRRAVDLRPLADIVLTLHRPLVGSSEVVLVNAIEADFPFVDGDEDRIEQVLHNLVGNAVKFTTAGEVTISAEEVDGEVSVTVADTGIGIAAADQERIFASFEQVEGDTARLHGGTGLGLAVSRQLVELHGGHLTVESEVGEGSRFSFTVPKASPEQLAETERASTGGTVGLSRRASEAISRAVADAAIELANASQAEAAGPTAGEPVQPTADEDHQRFKVLVVDDEPVNRQVLVNQLSLDNYRIFEASGGEEAMAAVAKENPDLVLLDIMMPRMSGYDVCRQLRQKRRSSDMPVIYLSAKNQVGDLLVGFETGANDYLTKPISKGELLARVRTHLELLDVHRNLERKVVERTQELSEANEELERLASVDGLTRIANRRIFDETLEKEWGEHQRLGATLSLLLVDIDFFKLYNDRYGHQKGDAALISVAQTVAQQLKRPTDLAARYGGEEFAAILPNTSRDGAVAIAQAILDSVLGLRIPHADSAAGDHLSSSIGVATLVPHLTRQPEELIEMADQALYRAKEKGRSRLEVAHA